MQVFHKIKETWSRFRSRRVFRACTNKYFLVTIIFMVICVIDRNGVLTLLRNKREIARQRETMEQYQNSIASIEERISSLTNNKDSIEAFAREEYYYHREGEDVFIVEE